MSAREVISLIEALPPEERVQVADYVSHMDLTAQTSTVRRMNATDAAAIAERVFAEHEELFRKLAQ